MTKTEAKRLAKKLGVVQLGERRLSAAVRVSNNGSVSIDMEGGFWGTHVVCVDNRDAAAVRAHWDGYCANNRGALARGVSR